ncbi:ribosomal RNA-processing protein 17 [Punica granatum]|uniref:Ribosomal RNA-processing protein 17 n=1 Tax=Punica granatum TaxID=22663 RepID=A0A6P8DM00_PUNGR|nr:ribosomal RNA-processing protein 17 [Punica granatum]
MEDPIEVGGKSGLPRLQGRHIKKRALKNKALSVTFNEKDLRDYVSGFHKRKKKRRKEAQKKQEEALRRKRIGERKKRKLEKELALFGGAPPPENTEPDEDDADDFHETDEEIEPHELTSGMMIYDNGHMKVTVTTSDISREDESISAEHNAQAMLQNRPSGMAKTNSLSVSKKKSFKRVAKQKPRRSSHKKRDRNKGKKKHKKKH